MTDVTVLHKAMLDAVRDHDWDALEALLHPDYIYCAGDGVEQPGSGAALAVAQTYTAAFPDLVFEVKHQQAMGNLSVMECRVTGTHKGDLMGMAPTGKRVELHMCNVIEERDGKIIREREYYDSGVMMQQLGVAGASEQTMHHRATVSSMYEAFGRGDIAFIVDQLSDKVRWDIETPHWGLPWYEARSGKQGVRGFFEVLNDELTFTVFEPLAMLASDDQLAAVIRFEFTVNATGKKVADTEVHLWTFDDDGRISAFAHVVDQHGQILAYEAEGAD